MINEKKMENKITIRISAELKQQIDKYCEVHNIKLSQFVRMACEEIFNK